MQLSVHSCCFSCAMFLTNGHVPVELGDYTWPNTHPKYNWCHQINGVRVWKLSELHLFVRFLLNCYRWPGRSHKTPLLTALLYFSAGALLFKKFLLIKNMKGIFAIIAALSRGLFTQVIIPVEISRDAQMIRSRR